MPRKTHASSKSSGRHYRRSYSSSSYSSSSSDSDSDSDSDSATEPLHHDRPLRHAATMQAPLPAPMGPSAVMQPRVAPPAVQATLPPFSTLYLHVHSAQNLQIKSRYAYCKLFVGNTPMVDKTVFAPFTHSQYQSFRTAAALVDQSQPVWNADFAIRINDPTVDTLSILVKRQHLLCCPIVGVCVVSLRSLIDSSGVDQWFPLRKGPFQTGHIRLQMLLKRIEQPTISPRARIVVPEAVVNYGAAASSTPAVPDRARSLDDDKHRRQKENRRHREARGYGRKHRDRRQEPTTKEGSDSEEEKSCSIRENQADASDRGRAASVEGVGSEKERREGVAERSGSSQSRRSHTCGRSSSGGHNMSQVDSEKPSSSSSARASSNGTGKRTLDDDLYGELAVSDRVTRSYGRERRRETCKSDPFPAPTGSDSIKSTSSSPIQQINSISGHENAPVNGTIELYAKCGAAPPPETLMNDNTALEVIDLTSPRCEAEKKGNNDGDGSETDAELSSSADSPIPPRSHRHRHKSKKKQRRKHRHHKHRQGDAVLQSQGELYTFQPEIPTYPAAPICVLPPPPPSKVNVNGVAAKKLALIATRVASIAFLGADYTKAFTNTASNQIAANVATGVAMEGAPVVAESEACAFEIE